jgi:SAM-dependent methyltransferase
MTDPNSNATRRSYDRVAVSYRERFEGELDDKPFDRDFLDAMAAAVLGRGWVIDLGSGPGQVGAYLARRGVPIVSLDLSLQMLRQSRTLVPDGSPLQADICDLPLLAGSVAGIVAFYSLVHIPPANMDHRLAELRRVLKPGGLLGITTHVTAPPDRAVSSQPHIERSLHVDEMLNAPVDLDFFLYGTDGLGHRLKHAGLTILRADERHPYPTYVEAQTRRAYVLAQRPREKEPRP